MGQPREDRHGQDQCYRSAQSKVVVGNSGGRSVSVAADERGSIPAQQPVLGPVLADRKRLLDGGLPWRVLLTYLWRHGRLPRLANPVLFNELVQARKLLDRDERLPLLSDKVLVKRFVAERIGPSWVTPTLWHGSRLPAAPPWKVPFVLKSRHGSNQTAFVRSASEDWSAVQKRAEKWQRSAYGLWLDEWAYRHIERGLLVEPFIGTDGVLPVDYKFFVFGGRVEFVQVHLNRESAHRRVIFNRAWRRVSAERHKREAFEELPPPSSLPLMIEAAEALAVETDFVRVDLYDTKPHPSFGELTFYPGSGLDPFEPRSLDALFGTYWLQARSTRPTW